MGPQQPLIAMMSGMRPDFAYTLAMRIRTMLAVGAWFLLSGLVPGVSGAGDEQSPEALVKQITTDVLDTIKQDPALRSGDRSRALALAEEKVLPHIDFRYAIQTAVGPPWAKASAEQQEKLVSEFRTMLVRVYSLAIQPYRGQTIDVQPVRMTAGATEVNVRNLYRRENGQRITIEYAMRKSPTGWKIFDITVEGVSLMLAYRADFSQTVRQSGVEGLLKALVEKNRAAAASGKAG